MKKETSIKASFIIILFLISSLGKAQKSILKLTAETLMHETRETPSPLDGQVIRMNPPRFMWPDKFPHLGAVLDGVEEEEIKPEVIYKIRIARDEGFTHQKIEAQRNWAFYNPYKLFDEGKWYWQYAYISENGEEWSPVYHFYVGKNTSVFNPPSFDEIVTKLPDYHPRILLDKADWEDMIERNKTNPEAQAYIKKAAEWRDSPLKPLDQEIDTSKLGELTNNVQRKSLLIRESRKIVDRQESAIECMIRAYLLTKDHHYYEEGMARLKEVISWKDSPYFAGDFNLSTILSMSTSAYDAFYNELTQEEKKMLLESITENGRLFFHEYVNHLENRIADNHVWQMTLRILTMASFSVYGKIPEAAHWADYCYNIWVSRFPGLNNDGAWHNGDSYFHVNIRTLIEVPAFYSRITGFDYFADPWYQGNAMYVIYHQPPFSKSAGNGNAHESVKKPNGARVGYADALARECNSPWAAAYVRTILKDDPTVLKRSFEGKSGDLTWYRCTTKKPLPHENRSLQELSSAKVFSETGLATMNTSLEDHRKNAMLSFRSSPYGSTSHALANQNAFNTFYGGEAIFYSSGHRTGFTDDHVMYSYRNTRAHNAILINGMGQKIGTEGYGWIPRFYEGEKISYVAGDASNAYGEISSPLWLNRGKLSGTEFTPEKGWDENKLTFFRRHIIQLGNEGLYIIYDELEAKEEVNWSYLLHTVEFPMEITEKENAFLIKGKNKFGVSEAYLLSSSTIKYEMTNEFFCPPSNWLNKTNSKGEPIQYPNHWHFNATTDSCKRNYFLTVIDTHSKESDEHDILLNQNEIKVGDWNIVYNLSGEKDSYLIITNRKEEVSLKYDISENEGATIITDIVNGEVITKVLTDNFPELEI